MPLEVAMIIFACYIMPIFEYGLVLWISENFETASENLANAMLTNFLKPYLSLPWCTNNSIVYHLTSALPLMTLLKCLELKTVSTIHLAKSLNGVQLTFVRSLPK